LLFSRGCGLYFSKYLRAPGFDKTKSFAHLLSSRSRK
jgi:hypothetical protein